MSRPLCGSERRDAEDGRARARRRGHGEAAEGTVSFGGRRALEAGTTCLTSYNSA